MSFRLPLAAAALLLAAALTACVIHVDQTGPTQYESRSFERDAAEELHLELKMGAGDLRVGSGTSKLAQAHFTYNVPDWKPEVRYELAGKRGTLTIRQPGDSHSHLGARKYEWDLRLGQDVPLSLRVHFGAGEGHLDLGSLPLRDVQVEMGVGELTMDLRGVPKHDYSVRIHGGVGEATVYLPSTAGVYAEASGGIGSIEVRNLQRSGGHWVNEAYGRSPVTVRVNVEGGVGEIRLIGD